MAKEYIEREKAIQICQSYYEYCLEMHDYGGDSIAYDIRSNIQGLPIADMVEVKHGKWKEHFAYDYWHYDCPFCDFGFATKIRQEETPNYCENCGAKMDEEEGAEE